MLARSTESKKVLIRVAFALLGTVWFGFAVAVALVGIRRVVRDPVGATLAWTAAALLVALAFWHWRLAAKGDIPDWFDEFVRNQ